MQVSLPLLFHAQERSEPVPIRGAVAPIPTSDRGEIVFHPRYRSWLTRAGVTGPEAALNLPGEVLCGHPDRHVMRAELRAGAGRRSVYLKREHVVGWKVRWRNWRDGFGWVSRCEREAEVLRRLEAEGLPGPQWLAYGTDGRGRAFLIVDEVPDAVDLRSVLSDGDLPSADRRLLAERVGRTLAELHADGFGTPELAAKHVLIGRQTGGITIIDWQSARPGQVSWPDRARQLAGLDASLSDGLATPRERIRLLWAYLRVARRAEIGVPRFGEFYRQVLAQVAGRRDRSSARDQRQPAVNQRLVWLAGEEVVAIPEVAEEWPSPPAGSPFYPGPFGRAASAAEPMTLPGGRTAFLVRFRTFDPMGRIMSSIRGRPWRSPAAQAARLLFHLERYGVPAPKLLAFGQRQTSWAFADSFVLYDRQDVSQLSLDAAELAVRLRMAECEWTAGPRPVIDSPFAVRLKRRRRR